MKKNLRDFLDSWNKNFIRDSDLADALGKTAQARYALVKRAFKAGVLIRLRKGLYLVASKIKQILPQEFELAALIYEPSVVSLESALSYHGWIPETVYATTSVSPKRAQEFKTPVGLFTYKRVSARAFYVGVARIATQTGTFFMAEPWRALADTIYTRRKVWKSFLDLEADLRIDHETLIKSDRALLKELSECYPSPRVRVVLKRMLKELTQKQ